METIKFKKLVKLLYLGETDKKIVLLDAGAYYDTATVIVAANENFDLQQAYSILLTVCPQWYGKLQFYEFNDEIAEDLKCKCVAAFIFIEDEEDAEFAEDEAFAENVEDF